MNSPIILEKISPYIKVNLNKEFFDPVMFQIKTNFRPKFNVASIQNFGFFAFCRRILHFTLKIVMNKFVEN